MTLSLTDTAVHESGHAVAHFRFNIPQTKVTIVPKSGIAGGVTAEGAEHVSCQSQARDQVLAYCASYGALIAAGRDAETAKAGADDDFENAANLIETWKLDGDLELWMGKAVELMSESQNVAAVKLTSERLLEHETLPGDIFELLVSLSDGEITADKFERYLELSDQRSFSRLPL